MKNKFELRTLESNSEIKYESGTFPGGEIRVKVATHGYVGVHIKAHLFNSDDIMTLVMLVDALRERGVEKIRLTMPYIPYARQDRVCNPGEALSIRAFARIINSLNFASVVVYDPHSVVSSALIDRCLVVPTQDLMMAHERLWSWISNGSKIYLLSPDAGSIKKTEEIAKAFRDNVKGIIYAEKIRDLATGKIIKTQINNVPSDITESRVLVCDDVIDGGRTFIEIANWFTDGKTDLRPKELSLYATHGIFSQGKHVLLKNKLSASECLHPNRLGDNLNSGLYDNVWSTIDFKEYS